MARTVARLISGVAIDVDLSPDATVPHEKPITIAEARQRIARSFGMPAGRICLVGPTAHEVLEDDALLGLEVGVVVLCVDLEAERTAEASLLQACHVVHMDNLLLQTHLDLRRNELSGLPESFGQLHALQHLDLQFNRLSSLPESFGQLTALRHLVLDENQLSSLPESFGQLTALQRSGLRKNKLSSLPERFGQLISLQYLDLR